MDVKATAKTVRVTPRKARLVLDNIRGKSVEEALAILQFTPNQAAGAIAKVVKSAAANAEHNNQMNPDDLFIKSCYADEGLVMKRYMPRAKGSASQILKRTSHITVVVSDGK
ncbi:MAG: 50S ribosomal protein L22 [Solobacterium sp.]|nr:50S ribosomal protein L22 [Solobacterium sp.]MBR2769252.1 50S ribosomal protein L22 [Solobacterium sp.]MBR2795045.1 50S ribosomal protein L22 [Solobacterium sp.]